ncbi:hypothetical protein [Acinetobacter larvae]|uniref:DUF2987 domain-containing protein n=1 Tax=Acinetobacter larvae TaxID=1789224 RepID=A0A1B2M1S8_9GAMM|nr:hypothetical protein [Acinetobacter larvae]AOA59142.1 hypothetical protein BFG52_12800 [Acinetobacter larvae]
MAKPFIITTSFICLIACSSLIQSAIAQSKTAQHEQQLLVASQNFEQSCVRALPTAVLLKTNVQQHRFQLKSTQGDLPIAYAIESAELGQQQNIRIENSGCEFYTLNIQLHLNAEKIEQKQQLCQTCLVAELKNLAQYFQIEEREFYLAGIEILEQQLKQRHAFEVGIGYQLNETEDMPQLVQFKQIQKQANGQYWIEFSNSIGPL